MNKNLLTTKCDLMKRILSVVTIAAVVTACNPGPRTEDAEVMSSQKTVLADTVGLAEYQSWKAQNELADFREYQAMKAQGVSYSAASNSVNRNYSSSNRSTASRSTTSRSSGSGTRASAPVAQKKGWSKAAKGAAIGAGTGAVLGAVINKRNRAVGAVIGGVAGGAVGYGIGRGKDKRDGRY
jgi:hypothetical protein